MNGFTLLPGDEPDEIDLELADLGAPLDPGQRARLDAALAGPLAEARADLDAARATFQAVRRPLPASEDRRRAPPRSTVWWRWAAGATALAAGLLLVLQLTRPDPGVRSMGGLPVDLAVRHDGGNAGPPDAFRAGDELFVRLIAPGDGVIEVATVQDDGAVSVLEPGHPVKARDPYVLDGAARLDDHGGREWLVVTFVPELRDAAAIEADAKAMLPDPAKGRGPHRFVIEVTRNR